MTFVPPYDHLHVIAGQGTAVKELVEETGPLDVVVTPLGGGGRVAVSTQGSPPKETRVST